ncbi:HdaA/DnaA family protein [Sphingomonas bacterium]|uniref:HdaA/DnaA family protein n=1 Tax=Sphingomonas bacterium TaxID=1895847 RepID=UPI001575586E|nr:chromosomal replication initiator DnaA [Sphingomonas bacterium]
MSAQLALPFVWPAGPGEDAFLVTASNARAVAMLDDHRRWPVRAALLVGPRKSGRSLLARIFAAKTGGMVIDDAEEHAEPDLFHAWNRAQVEDRPMLIVADAAPPAWPVRLPDLRSRLGASPIATIAGPDDALVRALLEREFLRRGLDARAELVDWLASRIERTHLSVLRVVDLLEREASGARRRLSVPFARATLAPTSMIVPEPRLL